jgi:beta-glucosidase
MRLEFARHFGRRDLEELFDDFSLPDDFLFGVANSAYQVEGGFNGPGQPLNNWFEYENSGKAERSGEAVSFWTDYPEQVELAAGIGLNAFRMSIEWARVQPGRSPEARTVPPFDPAAVEAYSDMLAAVMGAGMEPVVTLHHFTHPHWLGTDFWLETGRRFDLFRRYVEEVATRVNSLLVDKHSLRPVRYWVTINEPNVLSLLSYALGRFPHSERGTSETARSWSHMIKAHCRAYDTLHHVYQENHWDKPMVTLNTANLCLYHADKFATDLLLARMNGVQRRGLPAYIAESKAAWDSEIAACPVVKKTPRGNIMIERYLDRWTAQLFSLDQFSEGIDAIYASPLAEKLDYLAIDYYDPFVRNYPRIPSVKDIHKRRLAPAARLWEQVLNPTGLYCFLKACAINGQGLPLMVLENGMAYRARGGRVEARGDGATRDRFLQSYIYEVLRAVKDGLPVKGYFHWSLVDNFEWGSWEPRFGLYTIDRSRTPVKVSSVDAWGVNAARVYGNLISSLKSGDRDLVVEAFTSDEW